MTSSAEQNYALLSPDTLFDKHRKAYRGVLAMPSKSIRWWVCSHSHEHVTDAYDCARVAHQEVRDGVSTHRLEGRA